MARIVTPVQQHHIDPYSTRVFQWDTPQSDIFLSRVANSLLKAFGDDIVLRGLDLVDEPIYELSTDTLHMVLNSGLCIQDLTLLEFTTQNTVSFPNLSNFNDTGKIVIVVEFKWIHTLNENSARIKVDYIGADGSSFYGWNHDTHRLILGILEFENTASTITDYSISNDTSIEIEGTTYYLYGYDDNFANMRSYILKILEDMNIESFRLIDEGEVTQYADKEYDMKLINGNLELHEIT